VHPDPTVVGAAKQQLDEAEFGSHVWNDQRQRSLNMRVARLPAAEGLEISLRLANLINTGKVKVDRGAISEDPQACPCVPGICPVPGKTARTSDAR
jgi:hypothetical protein